MQQLIKGKWLFKEANIINQSGMPLMVQTAFETHSTTGGEDSVALYRGAQLKSQLWSPTQPQNWLLGTTNHKMAAKEWCQLQNNKPLSIDCLFGLLIPSSITTAKITTLQSSCLNLIYLLWISMAHWRT